MEIPIQILITGEGLSELQRQTWQMAEAFDLDDKIEHYQGQEPIALYRWDVDCLLDVIFMALDDGEYPDKGCSGYKALKRLQSRLKEAYKRAYKD